MVGNPEVIVRATLPNSGVVVEVTPPQQRLMELRPSHRLPRDAKCYRGTVNSTPNVGSNFGSNLPVLLAAKSGLNGAESTNCFKVNSRMLYR
jgi:hypothetical protein